MTSAGKISPGSYQRFHRSLPLARVALRGSRELVGVIGCAVMLVLHGMVSAGAADIVVSKAWSPATPKGAEVAAGYLRIENHGNRADTLLSVSTPVAGKVEIHQMAEADGIMTMRPMEKEASTIPPNGKLVFAPGGNHLMFLQLKAPFSEGEKIPVSLDFERAGKINTSLDVGGNWSKRAAVGRSVRSGRSFDGKAG